MTFLRFPQKLHNQYAQYDGYDQLVISVHAKARCKHNSPLHAERIQPRSSHWMVAHRSHRLENAATPTRQCWMMPKLCSGSQLGGSAQANPGDGFWRKRENHCSGWCSSARWSVTPKGEWTFENRDHNVRAQRDTIDTSTVYASISTNVSKCICRYTNMWMYKKTHDTNQKNNQISDKFN